MKFTKIFGLFFLLAISLTFIILVFLSNRGNSTNDTDGNLLEVGPIIDDIGSNMDPTEPLANKEVNFSNINNEFLFLADIPTEFEVTYNDLDSAINIFDPSKEGFELDQAQIYIKFFKANQFLTLQTVDILERTEQEIVGRPSVKYLINKKNGVADFANQPSWRNIEHEVTDIRLSDNNPTTFYVFARNPELDKQVFDDFLSTLNFDIGDASSSLVPPTEEFLERITLKPFGILIDPATSPVQPERFSGYHNAVDVEFGDVIDDVPVVAIAQGEVVVSRTASGYGGVVAISHLINEEQIFGIYGHLDPNSLVGLGTKVEAGQQIGILGAGGTGETDGERKHLHFGLYKGNQVNIAGYVGSKAELANWLDPLTLFE